MKKNLAIDAGPSVREDCIKYISYKLSGGENGCECTGNCTRYRSFNNLSENRRDELVTGYLGGGPNLGQGKARQVRFEDPSLLYGQQFDDITNMGAFGCSSVMISANRRSGPANYFEPFQVLVDEGLVDVGDLVDLVDDLVECALRDYDNSTGNEDEVRYYTADEVVQLLENHLDFKKRKN